MRRNVLEFLRKIRKKIKIVLFFSEDEINFPKIFVEKKYLLKIKKENYSVE